MPPEENIHPEQPPETKTPPPTTKPSATEQGLPGLRTMKYDASRYLKDKNISLIDLVAQEKKEASESNKDIVFFGDEREQSHLRWFSVLVTMILLALAGYAGFVWFLKSPTVMPTARPSQNLVVVEATETVTSRDSDRAGLLSKLRASEEDTLPAGSVKRILLQMESFAGATRYASVQDFFSTLDMRPPQELADNLQGPFNLVVLYTSDHANTGIIAQPKNAELALAGMRAWEKDMILGLRSLYFKEQIVSTVAPFEDAIIRNVDVRTASVSPTATPSYALFAGRYLLITTSREFMELLINRLLTSPPTSG